MRLHKLLKPFALFSAITVLMVGYTNCSQPKVAEIQQDDSGSKISSRLSISPADKTVNWDETVQYSILGGTPPYFFKVKSGAGTISFYEGTYVAPGFDRESVIEVTDATGAVAQTNVYTRFNASASLRLTLSSSAITPGDNVTLTASGGTAPYTYFMVSGVGTITGNIYHAASFGTGVIGVRDSAGRQGSFGVTVQPTLTIVAHHIYRHYHAGAQMYIYDRNGSLPDWTVQTSFKVLTPSTYLNTLPLTRCFINSAQGRYLSVGTCGAYTNEGVLGYVFTYAAANTQPLYNCFKSSNGKYMISTTYTECTNNGFSVQGILGHVPL